MPEQEHVDLARLSVQSDSSLKQRRLSTESTSKQRKAPRIGTFERHVDIVNYPPQDLLRLLASLLEQIARANDQLHTAIPPNPPTTDSTPSNDQETTELDNGTFDAAPHNSPISLPVTPGVDLLREVGVQGSAQGFMPSLGGAHAPVPLQRRRGSSFLLSKSSQNDPPITSLLTASSLALASPSATLCFHARNIPAISIEAYLQRILKYCPTTNEVFLSLLVYFDRMARVGLEAQQIPKLKEQPRLFAIDSYNVHRLVIAGVTVASKFFSDVFYTNSRYAKVGGLPLNELNQLELQFLLLNDFRLVIPLDELQRYADQLILFWIGRDSHPHPSTIPSPRTQTPEPNEVTTRPESLRSQPSSSGTSVTSTITPGSRTPTTPQAGVIDEDDTDGENEERYQTTPSRRNSYSFPQPQSMEE